MVTNMARIAIPGGWTSSAESAESLQAGGGGRKVGSSTATAATIDAGSSCTCTATATISSGAGTATATAGEAGSSGGDDTPLPPPPFPPPPGSTVPPPLLACLSQHLPGGLPFFSPRRLASLLRALHHLRVLPELGSDVHVALQQRLMSASVLVHLEDASDEEHEWITQAMRATGFPMLPRPRRKELFAPGPAPLALQQAVEQLMGPAAPVQPLRSSSSSAQQGEEDVGVSIGTGGTSMGLVRSTKQVGWLVGWVAVG